MEISGAAEVEDETGNRFCIHTEDRDLHLIAADEADKREWISAVAKAKDKVYGKKERVMFWLNMGTIQHYAGNADPSMANFIKAEKTMRDLWTTSISAEASKVIVGETFQSYAGEDFEQVLLYMYTSLNKAQQGNLQDALVEARRADEFLKRLKVQSL